MARNIQHRLLKSREVCEILQVTPLTLQNYRDAGKGPPVVRLAPRTIRYPSDELEAWIEAGREGAA